MIGGIDGCGWDGPEIENCVIARASGVDVEDPLVELERMGALDVYGEALKAADGRRASRADAELMRELGDLLNVRVLVRPFYTPRSAFWTADSAWREIKAGRAVAYLKNRSDFDIYADIYGEAAAEMHLGRARYAEPALAAAPGRQPEAAPDQALSSSSPRPSKPATRAREPTGSWSGEAIEAMNPDILRSVPSMAITAQAYGTCSSKPSGGTVIMVYVDMVPLPSTDTSSKEDEPQAQ